MVANGLLAHRTTTEPAANIGIVAVCENSRMGKCGRNQVAGPIDAVCLFWFWGVFGIMFIQSRGPLWMWREDSRDFGGRGLDVARARYRALPQRKASFGRMIERPSSFGMTGEAVDKDDTAAATISDASSLCS